MNVVIDYSKAELVDALEGVLGPIDTEEAAAAVVEAVYQALGWRLDAGASLASDEICNDGGEPHA